MTDLLSKGIIRRGNSLITAYERQFQGGIARRTASVVGEQSAKLARLDVLMHKIVAATFDAVITVSAEGKIETVNKSAARIFGFSETELQGILAPRLLPRFNDYVDINSKSFAVGNGHCETIGRRINGAEFPVDISISQTRFGTEVLFVIVARDITELREQQTRLEYQALHDNLTGLPNRLLLANRIEHALSAAPRSGKSVGLMLLDLDRFKQVNDTLGHHVGDWLLIELAKRLVIPVRGTDTVARLGGDEFAVLLPMIDSVEQARELAERLHSVFQTPFITDEGLALDVGCSIGLAMSPEHADEPAKLMQCADVAMYAAKEGPEKIVFYDQNKDTNTVRQLTMSNELRQAIRTGELTMEFQPQLDLRSRQIHGVEGLARWRHPRLGYVPPDEFIAHAEQSGLIQELTLWTLQAALSQMINWKTSGIDIGLSVNLSAKSLQDNALADTLRELMVTYPINPALLTLEITESALVSDPVIAKRNVQRLADLGIRLSIDDFGTGYSSLAYLQQLPLHELKIDKSFVFEMLSSHNENVIVRSTIDLAHNLGLSIVAEGVESLEHVEALSKLNCDIAQGFFISPALPADLLNQWLASSAWSIKRPVTVDNRQIQVG
jgi:diguanylate cyclase (GGDEF)-like protein/PAS domain S-box-containing protein